MSFGKTDNLISNLSRLSAEHGLVMEQRLIELYGLADAALSLAAEYAADGLTGYDLLAAITPESGGLDYPSPDPDTPSALSGLVGALTGTLSAIDRAAFSVLFVAGARERGIPVVESDLFSTSGGEESFIYSRNALADEAYDVLSQDFVDPRVRYGSGFAECVRAVSTGECRFCLLPLEEKGGTRLPTVAELIYRSDLKINAVTPVFGFDGTADLKYALLSRDFIIPALRAGDDLYLEIRLPAAGGELTPLLSVLGYLGLEPFRIDTLTYTTEGEGETCFSLVLRDAGGGFAPLLCYLALFVGDFTTVGLYKNLE